MHGRVDHGSRREWESFVVSEDDYINYLVNAEMGAVIPVTLAARLQRSHFLFLGYTPRDWNLRSSCTGSGAASASTTGRGRSSPRPTSLCASCGGSATSTRSTHESTNTSTRSRAPREEVT